MQTKHKTLLIKSIFAVYTDGLLLRLQEIGIGCHMGGHYAGALAHADDITLISPSMTGLTLSGPGYLMSLKVRGGGGHMCPPL